jgi:hypothetical protein
VAGRCQHAGGEVDADGGRAGAGRETAHVAGTAAEVDDAIPWSDAGDGHGGAAPALVEAEGEQAVEQVVARRNAIEHRLHHGCLLVRRRQTRRQG